MQVNRKPVWLPVRLTRAEIVEKAIEGLRSDLLALRARTQGNPNG